MWWAVISTESLEAVNKVFDEPQCTSCHDSVSIIGRFDSLLGKEINQGMADGYPHPLEYSTEVNPVKKRELRPFNDYH